MTNITRSHGLGYELPHSNGKWNKHVVILGGGFAGMSVAMILQRQFHVTIVDKKTYFENKLALYRIGVEPTLISQNQSPVVQVAPGAQFIEGEIEELMPEALTVSGRTISFDYLVIATGSDYKPSYGFNSHTVNVCDGNQMSNAYNKLLQIDKIAVIGGGPAGVEVTSELCETFPRKTITLINSSPNVLSKMSVEAQFTAVTHLKKYPNLQILNNERVLRILENGNVETNQTVVDSNLIYVCSGLKPNIDFMARHMGDVLDEGGIKVNKQLQVEGYRNIFAVGDVAATSEEKIVEHRKVGIMLGRVNAMIVDGSSVSTGSDIARKKQVISLSTRNLPVFNKFYK